MKREKKSKGLIGLNKFTLILILIYFLCGVGVTYAYFAFREENTSVIVGNVVAIDADLSVELVVGNNDGLVPMTNAALSNAINGVGSDNGACIDSLGNLSCQVYKIILTNNGSRLQHLNGTIKLYSGESDDDLYTNLKWQELTDMTTVKEASVVNNMSKSTLVSDLTLESKETKVWYVAVWLSETDYDQTYSDTGEFGGVVTFEAGDGIDGELNEYGFYYDKLYEMEMDGSSMGLTFYEDGSVGAYTNGVLESTQPAGSAVYDVGTITLGEMLGTILNNGTVIYFAEVGVTMTLKVVENDDVILTSLKFGEKYKRIFRDTSRVNVIMSMEFYEDGTVNFYSDDDLMRSGTVVYNNNQIVSDDGTVLYEVSNDGKMLSGNSDGDSGTYILGDVIIEHGDYSYLWVGNELGWTVYVNDMTKSTYGEILEELEGFPIIDLTFTFHNCTNLIDAPVIPSSVINMDYTFNGCTNLEGEIEINANPTSYSYTFSGTVNPIIITGSSTEETKANLAGTADNGNVSY